MTDNKILLSNGGFRDNGAHFYKCDFQVHTPRDSNWKGEFSNITLDIDRKKYADSLISYCRLNKINAIAITDHNDLCLWQYVKNAALNELNQYGKPYDDKDKIIVFPGVELTLNNPPCQAILIFDADIPESALTHIWGALGIIPASDKLAKYGEPQKVELTFIKIYQNLNKLSLNPEEKNINKRISLEGHYILLIHAGAGGHKSLMRPGFEGYYSSMPCVGGYVEQCLLNSSKFDIGTRSILDGKVPAWGSKAIGIFQTSDCREARKVVNQGSLYIDFTNLGAWPTWVKWTEPTAEALRQACISRHSKVYYEEPSLPSLRIVGVEVSNSKFLKKVNLYINSQFNAFIGGRGTGKSSLLEYIRWALCDDYKKPLNVLYEEYEIPNFEIRRRRLIENTLQKSGGIVTVFYEKYGLVYKITRSSNNPSIISVTQPDGSTIERTADQIRSEFPIVSYAQKQLSSVGTLPNEIYRLVTGPISDNILDINKELNDIILPKLKEYKTNEIRHKQLKEEIQELSQSIKSKKDQIKSIKLDLKELSPKENKTINEHEVVDLEKTQLNNINANITTVKESIQKLNEKIASISDVMLDEDIIHKNELSSCISIFNDAKSKAIKDIEKILEDFESSFINCKFSDDSQIILKYFDNHNIEYLKCLERSTKNAKQLGDIKKLNVEISVETEKLNLLKQESALLSPLIKPKLNPIKDWVSLHDKRAKIIRDQCELIEKQSKNTLKANVYPYSDKKSIYIKLDDLLSKGKSIRDRDEKINRLISQITESDNPIETWLKIIDEIETLTLSKGEENRPITPLLFSAKFSEANIETLRDNLTINLIESIRYTFIDDFISFEFISGKDKAGLPLYIPFEDASLGQQATSVLKTLLAQNGSPLLIDQPEEDLDNEQITAISNEICETKHNRQLIFVSHNANIVVNGDSELVVAFGYPIAEDTTRGAIICEGSIDYKPIRDKITNVMEGGKQAFELRRQKYGF